MAILLKHTITVLLLLAASVTNVKSTEDDQLYNNELFPRSYKYGRLQEALINQDIESRQVFGPLDQNGQGLFSVNPFVAFLNRLPVIRNPEFTPLLTTYDSCIAPNGESGVCLKAAACSLIGGRASGSCGLATVCCVSAIARCAGTVTLNNTYWRSPPTTVAPQSTCTITVRIDQNLPEQKKQPVCQVRLDFISFTIAQPTADSVCSTDTFQVSGVSGRVPVICGDNDDQHMYLTVPTSAQTASNVQLTFTFGVGVTPRNWNIKISMIPCAATYAAPPNCLQYFTGGTGLVKSFNWIDVAVAAGTTRQLANQDYSICFRNELVNGQRSNSICLQVCSVTNGGNPFRLSGTANTAAVETCGHDYLSIFNGRNTNAGTFADRFCGGRLNPTTVAADQGVSVQVCTTAKPFRIHFRTNGAEATAAAAPLAAETGDANSGFCLNYMQRRE